jgi:hypothetical protein
MVQFLAPADDSVIFNEKGDLLDRALTVGSQLFFDPRLAPATLGALLEEKAFRFDGPKVGK